MAILDCYVFSVVRWVGTGFPKREIAGPPSRSSFLNRVKVKFERNVELCPQIEMGQTMFPMLNALSLVACRSKCVPYILGCALARRLSTQMRLLCAQMCSRSTPVEPNAFPRCADALSLDACRSKCTPYVFRCALAVRLSTQMRFQCAQMSSRPTPAYPNALQSGQPQTSPR